MSPSTAVTRAGVGPLWAAGGDGAVTERRLTRRRGVTDGCVTPAVPSGVTPRRGRGTNMSAAGLRLRPRRVMSNGARVLMFARRPASLRRLSQLFMAGRVTRADSLWRRVVV